MDQLLFLIILRNRRQMFYQYDTIILKDLFGQLVIIGRTDAAHIELIFYYFRAQRFYSILVQATTDFYLIDLIIHVFPKFFEVVTPIEILQLLLINLEYVLLSVHSIAQFLEF